MSVNRRDLLLSAASTGLLAASGAAGAQTPPPSGEAARMYALFDQFVQEDLRRSPETASELGLDKGDLAWTKFLVSDASPEAAAVRRLQTAERLKQLHAIDASKLAGMDRINYDVVDYVTTEDADGARFPYVGAPYPITQLTGSYHDFPDFLDNQHTVETREDADAYLARLSGFAAHLDQEAESARHDAALGAIPPDFIIDKTLLEMRAFVANPTERAPLVESLARRAKAKGLTGDYAGEAGRIYEQQVRPALERQIALLTALRPQATHDAGVYKLKDGEAFYAYRLRSSTTSDMSPEEVHRLGLDLVASHSAQIDAILTKQGLTQGAVGQRLRRLYDDPKYRYPNTDAGKEKLIADLNAKVAEVTARLPRYFGALPKARLEIKRVPKNIEAGSPGGYYNGPPLDNSRPGIYWINLRDTAEVPTWTLPTLTYHEGIPGHHLQIALATEAGALPLLRKMTGFSSYQEGWALYAEQLAVEMGLYDRDPLGHVGQLHDSMFRAVRLVVDTGMHAKRWSREQAIKYMVDVLGDQESSAVTEIERYVVWPGQACSYMVGKLTWLRLRDRARKAMGPRFDIRRFHDAGLLSGAMPLKVLEARIDGYIRGA